MKTELHFKKVEGMIAGGFRQNWISCEHDGKLFDLDAGAGFGNPMLTFSVKDKQGVRAYYQADMREVMGNLIEAVNA